MQNNRNSIVNISKKAKSSSYVKNEYVKPIKSLADRNKFKNYWLNNKHGKQGRRNWTIFRTGIVTALRASDLVRLKKWQVYNRNGQPRSHVIYERDKKTKKANPYLDIKSLRDDLLLYKYWTNEHHIGSKWLFPKYTNHREHITAHYLYLLMSRTGDRLGIKHIGSHSLRKTFGYLAYKQTGNLAYVMKRLNQSNSKVTLRYIGLDKQSMDKITDSLNLN